MHRFRYCMRYCPITSQAGVNIPTPVAVLYLMTGELALPLSVVQVTWNAKAEEKSDKRDDEKRAEWKRSIELHVIRPSPKSWAYFYQRCVGCAVSCGSRCRCAGCSRLGCILSEDRSERKSRSSPQTLWWGYCAPQMAPYTEELQRNSTSGVWFRCNNFFLRILDGNRNDLYGIYNWLATYESPEESPYVLWVWWWRPSQTQCCPCYCKTLHTAHSWHKAVDQWCWSPVPVQRRWFPQGRWHSSQGQAAAAEDRTIARGAHSYTDESERDKYLCYSTTSIHHSNIWGQFGFF